MGRILLAAAEIKPAQCTLLNATKEGQRQVLASLPSFCRSGGVNHNFFAINWLQKLIFSS